MNGSQEIYFSEWEQTIGCSLRYGCFDDSNILYSLTNNNLARIIRKVTLPGEIKSFSKIYSSSVSLFLLSLTCRYNFWEG